MTFVPIRDSFSRLEVCVYSAYYALSPACMPQPLLLLPFTPGSLGWPRLTVVEVLEDRNDEAYKKVLTFAENQATERVRTPSFLSVLISLLSLFSN